jgi:L-ribulose-5-phosphate 3-epimerase
MFHTHSYANTIGGSGWDLWMLMRQLDPRYMGINFDIGHVTAKGGNGWRESIRAAHKHVLAVSVKDFHWVQKKVAGDEWPWETVFVSPGQGMVNFNDFFAYLHSINFDGPIETYFEYKVDVPGLAAPMDMLGTDYGKWKLEMPEDAFRALLKRDVTFYKGHLRKAGFNVAS